MMRALESLVKISELLVPEQDKDIKKPASDRYPRQIDDDEIPSKIDKDAFGREFVTGEMSVDQQPG